MRLDRALPVRLNVIAGESLSGYATRLAEANGLAPNALIPRDFSDATAPQPMIERIATAADITLEQATLMTLTAWPSTVRGMGRQQRHGWRLHQSVTWICPSCTGPTGYRALLWRLALAPVCLRCGLCLVQDDAIPTALVPPT